MDKSADLEIFLRTLGGACRGMRKLRGLTQVDACQAVGIDYRHYQSIEAGRANVRAGTMLLLANFYGLDIGQIQGLSSKVASNA